MGYEAVAGRDVLPIPDIPPAGLTTYDAKDPDTTYPPIEPLRPPAGAPNVLIVLIDDVGFGASSAFGGPCRTPNFERLAANGLKYNRFHTTALCSPTRSALLTGRNHHSVGMGNIAELATSAPGNSSIWPNTAAPLAKILQLNGYSTAQFGKCHEVPVWETSPMGPYRQWPTGMGFEYFYGFLGGETNQYYPALYEGITPVEPDKTPEEGYYFNDDLTSKTIKWIRQQKALMPDKPFFAYYAPGATHAPHHVPKEWADRYAGQFDQGWDKVREETFARQKELGVIPADCELTERSAGIPAWDDTDPELRPVLARQMEIYAGYLENTDHHVGLLIDTLEDLGILDDTLIYVIIGDNGASAEGSLQGTFNEMITLGGFGALETPEFMASKIDLFGGPEAYNHYAVGWAHAMDTPYQWTKQVASHWGGTRNGTIVHWPAGITGKGEIRSQFHHVIDVAPTVLEVAKLPAPVMVNGVQQKPIEGVSMALQLQRRRRRRAPRDAVLRDVRQPRHLPQGLDGGHQAPHAVGDRRRRRRARLRRRRLGALRHEHRLDPGPRPRQGAPGEAGRAATAVADRGGQVQRRAARRPLRRARPARDGGTTDADQGQAAAAVRRHGPADRELGGDDEEHVVLDHRRRHREGRRRARGRAPRPGRRHRRPHASTSRTASRSTATTSSASSATTPRAPRPIPEGNHQVRMEFTYDGGGVGKGGTATLYIDGVAVGDGRIEQTEAFLFSADETCDVGDEFGSPVTTDYSVKKFTGEVNWVELDLGLDDHNHLIKPEDRLRVAMGIQ